MSIVSAAKAELIQAGEGAGLRVTARQIDRYRALGLIPKAKLIGRGRGVGVSSENAPGTDKQLIALLAQLKKRRSIDEAALYLWIASFPIELKVIRRFLASIISAYDSVEKQVRSDPQGAASITERLADRILRRPKMAAHIRRLGNPDNLQQFLELLLGVGVNDPRYVPTSEDDAKTLAALFEEFSGLEQARTDAVGDAKPWLQGDATQDILSSLYLVRTIKNAVATASDQDLIETRELFLLLQTITAGLRHIQERFGDNAFGTMSLTRGLFLDSRSALDGPMGFCVLLIVRMANPNAREILTSLAASVAPFLTATQG